VRGPRSLLDRVELRTAGTGPILACVRSAASDMRRRGWQTRAATNDRGAGRWLGGL